MNHINRSFVTGFPAYYDRVVCCMEVDIPFMLLISIKFVFNKYTMGQSGCYTSHRYRYRWASLVKTINVTTAKSYHWAINENLSTGWLWSFVIARTVLRFLTQTQYYTLQLLPLYYMNSVKITNTDTTLHRTIITTVLHEQC